MYNLSLIYKIFLSIFSLIKTISLMITDSEAINLKVIKLPLQSTLSKLVLQYKIYKKMQVSVHNTIFATRSADILTHNSILIHTNFIKNNLK